MAQLPGGWDRDKYPDLPNPNPTVNQKAAKKLIERMNKSIAAGNVRPDHVNNALQPSFPPVINQSGGSCGAASSIYYQFTNQINTARFTAADSDERRYSTHFPWMLNTNGTDGTSYDKLGKDVGIASVAIYGGATYSNIYGSSGQDDQDDDCGWMQGYDKWFATMHNRIESGNSFPMNCGTPEGREIVKNYLWNRCGDDSYASGGVCGIGVAAGPFSAAIPKTTANDAAGVTGMKYVTDWNETYNHAMTIVGYDDRIEFDLDGNGVIGEECNADGDNEVGAWIICNSWGSGYENKGFIYCPYERSNCVKGWPKSSSFTPGYYDVVRDYRPLRTARIKMEYSRRSEMALNFGVAQDLNATQPEKSIVLTHFNYAGDGNRGKTQPAPEIPMLGRWADGELHTEPMEFGYDLTALTQDFDLSRPLKYFFWVETRSWGAGEGQIYEVSIIDYTLDRNGVEVPFPITEPVQVPSAGAKTELTAVVSGEAVPEPRNLVINGTNLSWDVPAGTRYEPASYKIYRDGELYTTTNSTSATVEEGATYVVTAIYQVAGYEVESRKSSPVVTFATSIDNTDNTLAALTSGAKIVVPSLISRSLENFTMEFWMMMKAVPTEDAFGFRMKADTTTYFFKIIKDGYIEIGNDGGSYVRATSKLSAGRFYHIAIVCEALETRVYLNSRRIIKWSNRYSHRGIKGPATLTIGQSEGTSTRYKEVYDAPWNGYLDDIRFWDYARTDAEIKDAYQMDIAQPKVYDHLLHYYNMSTRDDDAHLLIDGTGNSDAQLYGDEFISFTTFAAGDSKNPLTNVPAADFSCAATAIVGKPFVINNLSALNTAQWNWSFTGTETTALSGTVNPNVVFTEAGQQTITLQTTTLFGETAEKTATVEVAAASLPIVDFTIPEGDISAGEHVTFVNTSTPIEAATYEWDIEGAEQPNVKTVNAAATFAANGEYTVRLTAYSPAGSTSTTKTISVGAVAPEAAFSIQNNVILKGQQASLIDESRYSPHEWTWDVASDVEIYRVQGQNYNVTLNVPGIYDVTLTAANSKGSNAITRQRAITVCNADGQQGLHFDGADDLVTAATPFGEDVTRLFTIEWWMFPGRITDNGFRIGDKASSLLITVKPSGELAVNVNNTTTLSPEGTVIFDQWHHYAITYKTGLFSFYRDGQLVSQLRTTGANTVPALEEFCIGGNTAPFNGIIDELRVWNYCMTQAQLISVCNAPLDQPAVEEKLLLYYDFNQNGGDVIDRSSHNLTGTRTNFGPDGDAWDSSFGIFFLHPSGATGDVTATYLKNYQHPFKTGTGSVNPANSSRYLKLLMNSTTSPWKQVNNIKNGSILTEWHVDTQKNNYLTLETTWSGFESQVNDLMIFQTVNLPAGCYTFSVSRDDDTSGYNWYPEGTYIVATADNQLTLTADLESEALAWAPINDMIISFNLDEPTTVSLGVLSNMTGQLCLAIGSFKLTQKVIIQGDGGDYNRIEAPAITTEHSLVANGGLGSINIRVNKPQTVTVSDLSGKRIFRDWLDFDARIPVKRGVYIVNNQKVIVR